jgi:hypothetical protein
MSSSVPELGANSSKDPRHPPPPLESEQTESVHFTTPTKKSQRQNLNVINLVKGIPPNIDLGASSSKDLPSDSDSEPDDSEDDSAVKKCRSYKRQRIQLGNFVYFVKGDEATMDEDEMKSQVRAADNKIMEDSRMIRLPGHITRPGD